MHKSALIFSNSFPKPAQLGEELLLIYDKVLLKASKEFATWQKQFSNTYGVKAGEELKAVEKFSEHINKIVKICERTSARKLTVVVVGGGSVGDFGAFVASVLKRGVQLVHIPSTWLSAIDSAHGGKTALNVGAKKNQIGTFYAAEKIFLIKPLLLAQPEGRAFEGFSELIKIAWIVGGPFWQRFGSETTVSNPILWKYLELAIKSKNRVVQKDPLEKTGYRHILNLGHTIGHVFEAHFELPHGVAVNYGLDFALRWSRQKGILSEAHYQGLLKKPALGYLLSATRDQLFDVKASTLNQFRRLLLSDKKKTQAESVRFVFLKKPGACVIQEVSVDEILIELCRQREEDSDG